MSDEMKQNISDVNVWKRALFMVLFAILYGLAEIVIWAVVIFQFLVVLFTGAKNERLLDFGQKLTTYIYQIVLFQTFNTEAHPFPFGDWPEGAPIASPAEPEPVDAESDAESAPPLEMAQDTADETDKNSERDENPDKQS